MRGIVLEFVVILVFVKYCKCKIKLDTVKVLLGIFENLKTIGSLKIINGKFF